MSSLFLSSLCLCVSVVQLLVIPWRPRDMSSASIWEPPTAPWPTWTRPPRATHCAPMLMPVPQVVNPGVVEERPLLPSFLYLPKAGRAARRQPEIALGPDPRLTPSASSPASRAARCRRGWSVRPNRGCAHPGVDRKAAILPWKAPEGDRRVSPLEASTLYLKHLAEAWNKRMAGEHAELNRLEHQDIVLTVPASFDAAARETDGRGGPRRRAGAPHPAGGAAGRLLRLDRRQRRRLARAGQGRRRGADLRRGRRHHRLHA